MPLTTSNPDLRARLKMIGKMLIRIAGSREMDLQQAADEARELARAIERRKAQ